MNQDTLGRTMLFHGMSDGEISDALCAMDAQEQQCRKGTVILCAGAGTERMGLVLSGSVTIEANDLWGNRTVLGHVAEGQLFAETYALLRDETMPMNAVANEDSLVLFLRPGGLDGLSPVGCPWVTRLLGNLLTLSAHKNLALSGRGLHTAPKSARGRIMAYLNTVSLQKHSKEFDIPFDRQQMADYLNLDRSAMSKELGKMRRDGILRCRKNHFVILSGEI